MTALHLPAPVAVEQIKAWLTRPNKDSEANVFGRNWLGKCQAFLWQLCYEFGGAPMAYPDAEDARRASKIVSTDPKAAPFGAVHYWDLAAVPADHVMFGLGGDLTVGATSHYTKKWATGLGEVTVSDYSKRMSGATYLGWAYTNGRNTVEIIAPAPLPNQRVVGGSAVNRRTAPSTTASEPKGFDDLAPGRVVTLSGWRRGESIGGNAVWFCSGLTGHWFWSGGFTDTGTHDLADLNPKPDPVPPVEPPAPAPVPVPPAVLQLAAAVEQAQSDLGAALKTFASAIEPATPTPERNTQ